MCGVDWNHVFTSRRKVLKWHDYPTQGDHQQSWFWSLRVLDDYVILVTSRVGQLCHFSHFVCWMVVSFWSLCIRWLCHLDTLFLLVLVTMWITNPSRAVVVTSSPSLPCDRRVLSYGLTHNQYVLGDTFPTCCIYICLNMLNPRCKSLSFGTSSVGWGNTTIGWGRWILNGYLLFFY